MSKKETDPAKSIDSPPYKNISVCNINKVAPISIGKNITVQIRQVAYQETADSDHPERCQVTKCIFSTSKHEP